MNFRKAFAIGVSVAVLGIQASMLPPQSRGRVRTWPFVDYPMYSRSYPATATFRHYELRGYSCDGPGRATPLTPHDVRMEHFAYWKLLAYAAGDGGRTRAESDVAVGRLSGIVRGTVGRRREVCRVGVWRREYPVRDFRSEDIPWQEVRGWMVSAGGATALDGR